MAAKLTDAAIWQEFQNMKESTGWPDSACICAVVQNHAMDAQHADELSERVRAVVATRIAPLWG